MNAYKVLCLNKISENGLSLLRERGYEVGTDIENPDAILVRSANMHSMELAPSVKCIARAGAGTNNIPIPACSEKGIAVFNTPGANANAVKELVICAMLMSSRRVYDGISWVSSRSADEDLSVLVEKEKSHFAGPEIAGKTLGVVGLGAIGVMVANAAAALGMEVWGYDPYISVASAWGLSRAVHRAESLRDLMPRCDYVSLHMPLTDETRGVIGEDSLHYAKNGMRLLNFARAGLVDLNALKPALACGAVSFYATDFPVPELIGMKNVNMTPHLGASTPESEDNCAEMAAREIIDFLEEGSINHSVNMPDVHLAREGMHRLVIFNRNVPGMIGKLSALLSEEGLNIENMLNRSRGEYACTVIDTNTRITDEMMSHMRGVNDILSVRAVF